MNRPTESSIFSQIFCFDESTATLSDINRVIAAGVKDGLGEREIGKMIKAVAPSKSASRAQTIARTEVHSSSQGIAVDVARQSDIRTKKIWLTSVDDRTRDGEDSPFDHKDADGQLVAMDAPFIVSNERLQYPGEYGVGSAGNTINCRCVAGVELITN